MSATATWQPRSSQLAALRLSRTTARTVLFAARSVRATALPTLPVIPVMANIALSGDAEQVVHCAVLFINCGIGVSVGCGVRICDRYSSEGLTRYHTRLLATLQPERIEQRIVFVRVAMRPAIYCDGGDIARRIESTTRECAGKFVADVALKCF